MDPSKENRDPALPMGRNNFTNHAGAVWEYRDTYGPPGETISEIL